MSRTARQPIWWIALALAYSTLNLYGFTRYLTDTPSLIDVLSMPLEFCIIVGTVAFACGYRLASERFWQAIAILYVAD